MKFILLIAFLLFATGVSLSQELAVSQINFKTFYIGINNPISIVSNSVSCNDLFVKVDNGEIYKSEKCNYIVIPKRKGNLKLSVYSINMKDTSLLDTLNYNVKLLPFPKVQMNPHITHFDWNNQRLKYLSAYIENSEIELKIEITSFDIVLERKENTIDSIHYEGSFVDKRYLELLKKGKKDDKIWFKNVEIILDNKKYFTTLNPIYIKFRE